MRVSAVRQPAVGMLTGLQPHTTAYTYFSLLYSPAFTCCLNHCLWISERLGETVSGLVGSMQASGLEFILLAPT